MITFSTIILIMTTMIKPGKTLIHKQLLRTVFSIRSLFFCSIQFEPFFRLPSCLCEELERKRTRNSRVMSRYSSAIFRNSGDSNKCARLWQKRCPTIRVFACAATTITRALICHILPRKLEQTFVYQWVLQDVILTL